MSIQLLSFDGFVSHIIEQMGVDLSPDSISRETHLVSEALMDSIQIIEMLAIIEELGCSVDERVLTVDTSFGDLYHLYSINHIRGDLV